jgi:hypothetical protein
MTFINQGAAGSDNNILRVKEEQFPKGTDAAGDEQPVRFPINMQITGAEQEEFGDLILISAGHFQGDNTHLQHRIMAMLGHFGNKGDGGILINSIFAFITDTTAEFYTDG